MKQYKYNNIGHSKYGLFNNLNRKSDASLSESHDKKYDGQVKKQILLFDNKKNVEQTNCTEDRSLRDRASENYYNLFEKYHSKESLINIIITTFDNGDIFHNFNHEYKMVYPNIYQGIRQQTKKNIAQIEMMFKRSHQQKQITINQPLILNNYSNILSTMISEQKNDALEQRQVGSFDPLSLALQQNKDAQPKKERENMNLYNIKDTKIYLLLNEISWQKKRKQPFMLYYSSMEIKLDELLDYITHNQYTNYDLINKAKLIASNLNAFRAKSMDNCSLLALLQIFFIQYKNLQNDKLIKLKNSCFKSSQQNPSLKSESRVISIKGQHNGKDSSDKGSKRSKLSQPNVKKRIELQSLWITELG